MIENILFYIKIPLFIPHLFLYLIYRSDKLKKDLTRWDKTIALYKSPQKSEFYTFLLFIIKLREFRSLFYHRIGGISAFVRWYAPGMPTLYLSDMDRKDIGNGLVIHHGHSTRLNANKCGDNCEIWQNVTVGVAHSGGPRPTIGNNVKICTGAIVIGDINIGNNVTIAAGSVVVKDIPANCVVAGNPAVVKKTECTNRQ